METSICSEAYLSRKATPKNNTMTPKRTNVLPPKKKFQSAEGSGGVLGAAVRGNSGCAVKVGPSESDRGGCIGGGDSIAGPLGGVCGTTGESVCETVSAGPAPAGSCSSGIGGMSAP